MTLKDLLIGIDYQLRPIEIEESAKIFKSTVNRVCIDSRIVQPGDVFIALRGQNQDGHKFLEDCWKKGAVAALVEEFQEIPLFQLKVSSTLSALAKLAGNYYGHPNRAMELYAVTGTNGKTTTTFLLENFFKQKEKNVGLIGTVFCRDKVKQWSTGYTTPNALELQKIMAEMREDGVTHLVMEASSHALALERLQGVSFRVAGFTNLSLDHLDFHHTMEAYYEAKKTLFLSHLSSDGTAVICVDDLYGKKLAEEMRLAGKNVFTVSSIRGESGHQEKVDLQATLRTQDLQGMEIKFDFLQDSASHRIETSLIGEHNVQNIAVAVGMALVSRVSWEEIQVGIKNIKAIPGRLERINLNKEEQTIQQKGWTGPFFFVDYAHTPDALARVLKTLRFLIKQNSIQKKTGKLFALFGCGGNRDQSKREIMGKVAAKEADFLVLTSDNPRNEEPWDILHSISKGIIAEGWQYEQEPELMKKKTKKEEFNRLFTMIEEREKAIDFIIQLAEPEDVVLIAGKGHEAYQEIKGRKIPFDDRQISYQLLAKRFS